MAGKFYFDLVDPEYDHGWSLKSIVLISGLMQNEHLETIV
jgi:hypothetical protein